MVNLSMAEFNSDALFLDTIRLFYTFFFLVVIFSSLNFYLHTERNLKLSVREIGGVDIMLML